MRPADSASATHRADTLRAEAHLAGHAYHTYQLTSPDGLVGFEFQVRRTRTRTRMRKRMRSPRACAPSQHNVCGRSIYAQGTVDAVLFIAAKARERSAKTLFNMVDVLSAGMC